MFDLNEMIERERAKLAQDVNAVQIPWSCWHLIVREYLLHHGYSGTVAALDKECNTTNMSAGKESNELMDSECGNSSRGKDENGTSKGASNNSNGKESNSLYAKSFKEACASDNSKVAQDLAGLALQQRGLVRQLILDGRIDEAIDFVRLHFPLILADGKTQIHNTC